MLIDKYNINKVIFTNKQLKEIIDSIKLIEKIKLKKDLVMHLIQV